MSRRGSCGARRRSSRTPTTTTTIRLAFSCAAPPGAQQAMVASDPERFFVPPYVGGRGWLGVYLDVPVDWDEITEIVEDAYRMVAPKKLIEQVDEA